MSMWAYVNGVITVSPVGRTQEEKEYILKSILNHLPLKNYSDGHMDVYINVKNGHNHFSSHNEFGQFCGYQQDRYPHSFETQEEYILTLDCAFRHEIFEDTYRFFIKWLTRLAKRVSIYNILVQVHGYSKKDDIYVYKSEIIDDYSPWFDMVEYPSWGKNTHEPAWCEYLLWKPYKDTSYPKELLYKYRDKYGLTKEDFKDD